MLCLVLSAGKQEVHHMKKAFLLFILVCLGLAVLAAQNRLDAGASSDQAATSSTYQVTLSANKSSIVGPPTISAAFIDQVLGSHNSPATGTGQDLYALGVKYGIDPVYALAFFHHESSYGTTGEARVTHSLGNERCLKDRPCTQIGYALMYSWVDGYEHWYSLMLYGYVRGQVTIGIVGYPCSTADYTGLCPCI